MFATVVAAAYGCLHLDVRLLSSRYHSSTTSWTAAADPDRPPMRGAIVVAVDGGWLTDRAVAEALRSPLEDWYGTGNVTTTTVPQAGAPIIRPLLVVVVDTSESRWTPLYAHMIVSTTYFGIDPHRQLAWSPAALGASPTTGMEDVQLWNRLGGVYRLEDTMVGLVGRGAYRQHLARAVADGIMPAIVGYAQQKSPPGRVPPLPTSSPLTVDIEAKQAVRCGGVPLGYAVEYDEGWQLRYHTPYDEAVPCEWRYALRNASESPIELRSLSSPDRIRLAEFGEAECRAADGAWGSCRAIPIPPGVSVQVRMLMRFDWCERDLQHGGSTIRGLVQQADYVTNGRDRHMSLPWPVVVQVTSPDESHCQARFPVEDTRQTLAAAVAKKLRATGSLARDLTAADLHFRDILGVENVAVTAGTIPQSRRAVGPSASPAPYGTVLALFTFRGTNARCAGIAGFDRQWSHA
jgi:hypothetical protein